MPDGCVDIILNQGPAFSSEHGNFLMDSGEAYLVGIDDRV